MSTRAKATLAITSAVTALTIVGVHYLQKSEKAAMHAGVLRDEERTKIKRERQLDFELQRELEKELLKKQSVRDTSVEGGSGGPGAISKV